MNRFFSMQNAVVHIDTIRRSITQDKIPSTLYSTRTLAYYGNDMTDYKLFY